MCAVQSYSHLKSVSYLLQTQILAIYVRSLNYHVITFDYRGYADSTAIAPDETGVVNDAKVTIRYFFKVSLQVLFDFHIFRDQGCQ